MTMRKHPIQLTAAFLTAALLTSTAGADDGFWQQQPEAPATQPAEQPAEATAFDGVWHVAVEPTGAGGQDGATPFADGLLFRGGHLTAAACAMYGFAPAAVSLDAAGGVETFEAEMPSDTHGTMRWTGRRSGTGLIGELAWTKEDGRTYRYTFTAAPPDQVAAAE